MLFPQPRPITDVGGTQQDGFCRVRVAFRLRGLLPYSALAGVGSSQRRFSISPSLPAPDGGAAGLGPRSTGGEHRALSLGNKAGQAGCGNNRVCWAPHREPSNQVCKVVHTQKSMPHLLLGPPVR